MISLALGDTRHNPEYAWLLLQGGVLLPGLVGASYVPAQTPGETVHEQIVLRLKGSLAEMDATLQAVAEKLALAQRYNQEGVGFPQYLRVRPAEDQPYYYARILSAEMVPCSNSLRHYADGSLGVEIQFSRPNFFDAEECALPLSNSAYSRVTSGLSLVNHDDSGNDNAFRVDAADVETELPAPLRLEITNTYASGELKDLWVGSFQYGLFGSLPQLVLQAEDGSGGTTQSSTGASGGAFQRFSWSDAGWSDLSAWTLSPTRLAAFQGRVVMPILRLAAVHAYAGLLARLSITSGGVCLYTGADIPAPAGEGYLVFPTLRLPCGELVGLGYPRTQEVHLQVYKDGSDSCTLDVDDLLLLPQDSFSRHIGLVPLAQNERLAEDAFEGISFGVQSDYELATHISIGKGHFLQPQQDASFMLFQGDASGLAPIGRSVSVKAWYRQRRRVL